MADRLEVLLSRFSVRAEVFNTGLVCGAGTLTPEPGVGQMHLVRRGPLRVTYGGTKLEITEPSLLLYPRAIPHHLETDPVLGAELACANLVFEGGERNPICSGLPDATCLPLGQLFGASPVLGVLFEEAFADRCGRMALVNRLFEVVIIQVLRQLMETGDVRVGMLSGLGHPRLRHAIVAMHEAPAHPWTLEELSKAAGMSRSAFASTFRDVLGQTPGQYLQAWRITLAQQALLAGKPIKVVASDVGYGSEAALSRAFSAYAGQSPRAWKRAQVKAG